MSNTVTSRLFTHIVSTEKKCVKIREIVKMWELPIIPTILAVYEIASNCGLMADCGLFHL